MIFDTCPYVCAARILAILQSQAVHRKAQLCCIYESTILRQLTTMLCQLITILGQLSGEMDISIRAEREISASVSEYNRQILGYQDGNERAISCFSLRAKLISVFIWVRFVR